MTSDERRNDTRESGYTKRLLDIEGHWLKRALSPVNPYRWNIRRLTRGKTLDIGCGVGRNLRYLGRLDAVGVDHNDESVAHVRSLGFQAFNPDQFQDSHQEIRDFDTLLISHVLEHLSVEDAKKLLETYLPYLKHGGQVVVICPQERGYESDSTHVTYFTGELVSQLLGNENLTNLEIKSFPLPTFFGRSYIYNEHIVVATK